MSSRVVSFCIISTFLISVELIEESEFIDVVNMQLSPIFKF